MYYRGPLCLSSCLFFLFSHGSLKPCSLATVQIKYMCICTRVYRPHMYMCVCVWLESDGSLALMAHTHSLGVWLWWKRHSALCYVLITWAAVARCLGHTWLMLSEGSESTCRHVIRVHDHPILSGWCTAGPAYHIPLLFLEAGADSGQGEKHQGKLWPKLSQPLWHETNTHVRERPLGVSRCDFSFEM